MNVVLYTDDMEAITVIDLPQFACDMLKDGQRVRVAAPLRLSYAALTKPPESFAETQMKVVEIWAERFVRKGQSHLMLFTGDEETALLLRADFLPGQRHKVQQEYKRGLIDGLSIALGGR